MKEKSKIMTTENIKKDIEKHSAKLSILFRKNDSKNYSPYSANTILSAIRREISIIDNLECALLAFEDDVLEYYSSEKYFMDAPGT